MYALIYFMAPPAFHPSSAHSIRCDHHSVRSSTVWPWTKTSCAVIREQSEKNWAMVVPSGWTQFRESARRAFQAWSLVGARLRGLARVGPLPMLMPISANLKSLWVGCAQRYRVDDYITEIRYTGTREAARNRALCVTKQWSSRCVIRIEVRNRCDQSATSPMTAVYLGRGSRHSLRFKKTFSRFGNH